MAEKAYVRGRYRLIVSSLGAILAVSALIALSPLLLLLWIPEESYLAPAFLIPGLATALVGVVVWRGFRPAEGGALSKPEGGVIVVLSWLLVCLFSTAPFMIGMGLSFRQGLFEAVSGWTTTGLSVVNESETPAIFLLWRSTMQLSGGAGLAIIMLSSIIGPGGAVISAAEGRDQLLPQVRRSAALVLQIYLGYIVVGVVGLYLAGMNWFDAVNHAFAALSTGGFSTRPESIGYWDSVAVEAVTLPLMILGNLSFVTAWALLRGRFGAVGRNGELRVFVVLTAIGIGTVLLFTTGELYGGMGDRARIAVFNVTSAITTTGFATTDFAPWNGLGVLTIVGLMLVGGGTVSTAGGIKQFRIYVLWRTFLEELKSERLPRTAVIETPLWIGEQPTFLDSGTIRRVTTFFFIYLGTFAIGVAVMTGYGYSFRDSIFEYASTVGTVGLSIGVTGADNPAAVHWVQIMGMILGRLEFFVVISGLTKLLKDAGKMVLPGEPRG